MTEQRIHLIEIAANSKNEATQVVTCYDNEEDIDQEHLTELIMLDNVVIIKGERLYPQTKNILVKKETNED